MNRAELMQYMARGGYRLHKEWGLMAPESPTVDEGPEPAPTISEPYLKGSWERVPFDGTQENPLPLGGQNE